RTRSAYRGAGCILRFAARGTKTSETVWPPGSEIVLGLLLCSSRRRVAWPCRAPPDRRFRRTVPWSPQGCCLYHRSDWTGCCLTEALRRCQGSDGQTSGRPCSCAATTEPSARNKSPHIWPDISLLP